MWERFTERAKRAVSAAREEASRLGSDCVGDEHILLGLCRDSEAIAVRALKNLEVDIEALVIEIEQQTQPGSVPLSGDDLIFTPHAKKVLKLALEEAYRGKHFWIGTEHILLGYIACNEAPGTPGFEAGLLKQGTSTKVNHSTWQTKLPFYDAARTEINRVLEESNRDRT